MSLLASPELVAEAVRQSLAAILLLVCFRAAPFLAYALASTGVGRLWKTASLAALLASAALIVTFGDDGARALLALGLLYVYLAALALCLPALARALRAGWIARLPLAFGLGFAYVFVPVGLSPASAVLPSLLLGFDSWLKSFSYCADAGDDPRAARPASTLFFMLVSPTLVWAERGHWLGAHALWRFGAGRVALALGTFAAQDAVRFVALSSAAATLPAAASAMLHGIAFYFGHSGLASLQIGCMAVLGYAVPERYAYPLFATSPLEFWRRWNTWIGSWARRYLFAPLSTRLRRAPARLPSFLAQGTAALATFIGIGVLHDAARVARPLHAIDTAAPSLAATAMFTVFGLLLVAWAGIERLLRKSRSSSAPPSLVQRTLCWTLFLPFLVLMSRLAQDALSG